MRLIDCHWITNYFTLFCVSDVIEVDHLVELFNRYRCLMKMRWFHTHIRMEFEMHCDVIWMSLAASVIYLFIFAARAGRAHIQLHLYTHTVCVDAHWWSLKWYIHPSGTNTPSLAHHQHYSVSPNSTCWPMWSVTVDWSATWTSLHRSIDLQSIHLFTFRALRSSLAHRNGKEKKDPTIFSIKIIY